MSNLVHERFKDAPWYSNYEIGIGGVGGIGSWLAVMLAKAGHTLYLYDFDTVEIHNLGGQLYRKSSIGKPKTQELRELCAALADNTKVNAMGKFDENSAVANIMFSCFDNITTRKKLAEKWYKHQISKTPDMKRPNDVNVLIDGRMEAETAIIYVVDGKKSYDRYKAEWFEEDEVPMQACTFRTTSHNPAILAGFMVSILNNVIANKLEKNDHREVPYKIMYELPTLTFDLQR